MINHSLMENNIIRSDMVDLTNFLKKGKKLNEL